ncbi:MAG: hypothetical protein AB8C84_11300 [Oligoflexales bacterium]
MESRFTQLFTCALAVVFCLPLFAFEAPALRVDCQHLFEDEQGREGNQPCADVSGLRMELESERKDGVVGRLVLDPFGSASQSRAHLPSGQWRPAISQTPLLLVDEYKLSWSPRNNFEMLLGSHGGVAVIPSVSGLSMAQTLIENGWNQTALSLMYNLSTLDGMKVSFVAGNGEGENGVNLDPQQYLGFQAKLAVFPGVVASLGVSQDGNHIGSYSASWQVEKAGLGCSQQAALTQGVKNGYSTQRAAASLLFLGKTLLPGLKVTLGVHRVIHSDLDKESNFSADYHSLGCHSVEPSLLFVEDRSNQFANRMQKLTTTLNASYEFFDDWFVGFDYGGRTLDTGDVDFFSKCESFDGQTCVHPSSVRSIDEMSLAVGGGVDLAEDLSLTVEYSRQSYGDMYDMAWYADGRHASDTRDAFNARLSWRWADISQ